MTNLRDIRIAPTPTQPLFLRGFLRVKLLPSPKLSFTNAISIYRGRLQISKNTNTELSKIEDSRVAALCFLIVRYSIVTDHLTR